MRRIFPLIMLLMTGSLGAPARADLTHRMTSSTQLQVNGAYTDATRVGSTYTVSGSNIKVATDAHFGKLTAGTATTAATLDVGAYDINTAGSAFTFRVAAVVAVPAVNLPKCASVATLILDPETV